MRLYVERIAEKRPRNYTDITVILDVTAISLVLYPSFFVRRRKEKRKERCQHKASVRIYQWKYSFRSATLCQLLRRNERKLFRNCAISVQKNAAISKHLDSIARGK